MYNDASVDNTDACFSRWESDDARGFHSGFRSLGRASRSPISAPGYATTLPQVADSEHATTTLDPPASKHRTEPTDEPVPNPSPKKKKRRRFSMVGLVWMFAALALSGFCLFMGLTGFHPDTKPIDQFHVGMIVPPDALHGDNDLLYGERVHPKTWRHLFVKGKKDDGSRWDADLLVPLWWITEHDARVGGQVHISVPECNIDGQARVVTLGPCPEIDDIDGRVVTSVFRHHSANVLDLRVEGLAEPIGTTANHPFFSVDHAEFVRADELQPGEMLRLIDGTPIRVISSTPRPGTHTVYNLQVSVDHVYHVTKAGVLVHNSNDCSTKEIVEAMKRFDVRNPTAISPGMSKPSVTNSLLQQKIDRIWKGVGTSNQVGSGSLMDAVRHEAITGMKTRGKFHYKALQNAFTNLRKELAKQGHTWTEAERRLAQKMLEEMEHVLRQGPGRGSP